MAILGLKWDIFSIQTNIMFKFNGVKPMRAGLMNSNKYKFNQEFASTKNQLSIMEPTGLISVNFSNYKQQIYMGQIKEINMVIGNVGVSPINKIELCFKQNEFIDQQFIKINETLNEKQETKINFKIRVNQLEVSQIHILIRYTCEDQQMRFYRCILPIKVLFKFIIVHTKLYSIENYFYNILKRFNEDLTFISILNYACCVS